MPNTMDKSKRVKLNSTVTLQCDKVTQTYTIVPSSSADPFEKKISCESPLGKCLLEKEEKTKVEVNTPNGVMVYEIVEVK